MPETRSSEIEFGDDVRDHWAFSDENRAEVAKAARELAINLRDADTFQDVFSVERLHLFPGDLDAALQRLQSYAVAREIDLLDSLRYDAPVHREAQAVAWTTMVAPDGTQINVTARQGASADAVAATVLALTGAARILSELGFVTQKPPRR